uniref:Homeobox domain-containing protein n=1 Tax=Nothobranchius furzeri TaxID=105023 RepID=A0A8C6NU93_NOTFU
MIDGSEARQQLVRSSPSVPSCPHSPVISNRRPINPVIPAVRAGASPLRVSHTHTHTLESAAARGGASSRLRTACSTQLLELEREFHFNKYLSRPKAGEDQDLTEKKVEAWFQDGQMKHMADPLKGGQGEICSVCGGGRAGDGGRRRAAGGPLLLHGERDPHLNTLSAQQNVHSTKNRKSLRCVEKSLKRLKHAACTCATTARTLPQMGALQDFSPVTFVLSPETLRTDRNNLSY